MKRLLLIMLLVLPVIGHAIKLKDIRVRDPFILTDSITGRYYLYCSNSVEKNGKMLGGVAVYWSKDLKDWHGPKQVFTVDEDNWITGLVWAPEVHKYEGQYYLFATLNTDLEFKAPQKGLPPYYYRGTQVFHSDSPEGPFEAFDKVPHTLMDRMSLDGTLYVEDGVPYMVYCHEWVQLHDGTIELIQLSPDLARRESEPQMLFHASAAKWSNGLQFSEEDTNKYYVTDGCFMYRTKNGKLLMLWSSFYDNNYAMGIAESATGKVRGPWRQHQEPLYSKDGGHGMIFRTFDGRLFLVFHTPNAPTGAERAAMIELEDTGDDLIIKQAK